MRPENPAHDAFFQCVPTPICTTGGCTASDDGSYKCGGTCNGALATADREPDGSGGTVCTRALSAVPVGTCLGPAGPDARSLDFGCCADFW